MTPTRRLYLSGGRSFDLALPNDVIKSVHGMAGAAAPSATPTWVPIVGVGLGVGAVAGAVTWWILKRKK